MDILQNILGGGQQQQQLQDFANRYQQGAPYDGISDQETLHNYQQVAPHLPPQMFQEAAQESYSRLSPQQRMELGQYLVQGARQQGLNFPDVNQDGVDDRMQDPRYLAQVTSQMRQQQPGLFSQLLGGALGGGMPGGGMPGGGMLGGGGAGDVGQLLNNPIAKAALAGIAATAVQRMMRGR